MPDAPELSFTVPVDDPCLPGHFPGRPVVPGVLLLDAVLERVGRVLALDAVRFTGPVLPGERVRLSWRASGDRVEFAGHVGSRAVLRGRARLGPPP